MADIVAILRSRADGGLNAHGQAWCDGMRAAANIVAGHRQEQCSQQALRDAVVGELEVWVETAGEDPDALADSILAAIDHARGDSR